MNKPLSTILFVILIFVISATTTFVIDNLRAPVGEEVVVDQEESLADRVLRAGKIRSGWLEYAPFFWKDPNTGEFSGIFYDIVNSIGYRLGLTVEWTEEVGYGTMLEGLATDRYDIIGCGIWANAKRAREADFTKPMFYSPVSIYVRYDDTRFDSDISKLNSKSTTFATIDGEMGDIIVDSDFPEALKLSLPQMAHISQNFLNVAQGKADVTISEPHFALKFNSTNPSKVKNISKERPIRIFSNTIVFKKGEYEFKRMIDTAIDELLASGVIDRIISNYEEFEGMYYRTDVPYNIPD